MPAFMSHIRAITVSLSCLLYPIDSPSQVLQSGSVTPGHTVCWTTTGVVQDCGIPALTPYMLSSPLLVIPDTGTLTPDYSQAVNFSFTLVGTGRTMANPINLTTAFLGMYSHVYFLQDATGNRTITSWGSAWKFSAGAKPTLSTGGNAVDRITCLIRSTAALDCSFTGNYQ